MPTSAATLQDLAKRISKQEAQLAKLRRTFEARQARLADLTRRKAQLQAQLQKVEAEIRSVGQADGAMAAPARPSAAVPAKPATKRAGGISLPQLLVELVKQANRPLTIKQLTVEVVRRKYPTTTRNIPGLIKSRVTELVRKGTFRRAANQPGVLLAQPASPTKALLAKPAKPAEAGQKETLAALLARLLAKSMRPLKARELAKQAKASGYQTKSKDFTNVIWVAVSKLPNVENVPGKGYRLKKR
jgi:hypothetical protein